MTPPSSPRAGRSTVSAATPACIERVRKGHGHYIRATMEPCQNRAAWRVDGVGEFGTLYSHVPMCSIHRRKYDRAGYRSWPIEEQPE